MTGIIFFLASTIAFLSVALVFPVVLALATKHELATGNLVILSVLGLFCSALLLSAISGRVKGMNRVQSMLAVVLLWIVVPIIGALPFIVTDAAPAGPALFEAYSGITTTGATIFGDSSQLPLPLRLWRSELEWIGGFMTLVCVLHVLAPAGIGGLPKAGGRFVRGEHELTSHFDLARLRVLFIQYSVVTLVVALALIATGQNAISAIMLAMLAISTGGFVPVEQPLDLAIGKDGVFVMAAAFAIGATSLFWQHYSVKDLGGFMRRNREAVWIFRIIAALALVYAILLYRAAGSSSVLAPLTALNEGFFTAASIVATSGIETRPGVIGLLPSLLVIYVVLSGASIYSTSSGIKLYRMGGMFMQAKRELDLLVYPSSIGSMRFGGVQMDPGSSKMVWTVFVLATVTLAGTCFSFAATGMSFEASFTAATALFANAGPVYSALIPLGADPVAWPGYDGFGGFAMFAGVVAMILGRLEVLVVLTAFNIAYWANR